MDLRRRRLFKYGLAALPLGLVPVAWTSSRTGGAAASDGGSPPRGWSEVWSDEFRSLSLRRGGPTFEGLVRGSGVWSASAPWYGRNEPRGWEGYGFDWFVDPSFPKWPADYPKLGQFAVTPEGVRIRAEEAPPQMAALLPRVRNAVPWLSGQLNSFYAVRIKPPFYFSCRARMPAAAGTPWPAIWLMSGARRPWPNDVGKEFEIDVHEGFGDDDKLHATIHWHEEPRGNVYPERKVVVQRTQPLSRAFNTWGTLVLPDRIEFSFNGAVTGTVQRPGSSLLDQHFGIILNVSAGLSYKPETHPKGGPHDMTVRDVRLFAPDRTGLVLHNAT